MMIPLLFVSIFHVFQTHASTACLTTREFITTLEFLRSYQAFSMKEDDARTLAFKVSEGCTGSAKRFIRVAQNISKAGGDRKLSTDTALNFAKSSDAETESFIQTLQTALAEDGLDMDLGNSLKIAHALSKEYRGDHAQVRKDFEKLANYCADSNHFGLPRNQCGNFASKIAKAGETWKDGISKPFIQNFEYLVSTKGPQLTTGDALKISEKMALNGPETHENFSSAYQYAISNSGLGLPRNEAIAFALKMASIQTTEIKSSESVQGQGSKTNRN